MNIDFEDPIQKYSQEYYALTELTKEVSDVIHDAGHGSHSGQLITLGDSFRNSPKSVPCSLRRYLFALCKVGYLQVECVCSSL